MRCIGVTKNTKRCRRTCKYFFCDKHRFQAILFIISLGSAIIYIDDLIDAVGNITGLHLRDGEEQAARKTYTMEEKISQVEKQKEKMEKRIDEILSSKSASQSDLVLAFRFAQKINECESLISALRDKIYRTERSTVLPSDKEQYTSVINNYENNRIEKAYQILSKLFPSLDQSSEDKKKGLVVACYYGLGEFDKAINIILERDRTHERWNFSLREDMFLCLRNYRLTHSLIESMNLVKVNKKTNGDKLLSYFGLFCPIEVTYNLTRGIHSEYDIDSYDYTPKNKNKEYDNDVNNHNDDIQYCLDQFEKDKHRCIGYYLLKDYKSALKNNPDKFYNDVFTFARATQVIEEVIKSQEEKDDQGNVKYIEILDLSVNKSMKKKLKESEDLLLEYINKYSQCYHFESAFRYYLQIELLLNNEEKFFETYNKFSNRVDDDFRCSRLFELGMYHYKKNQYEESFYTFEQSKKFSHSTVQDNAIRSIQYEIVNKLPKEKVQVLLQNKYPNQTKIIAQRYKEMHSYSDINEGEAYFYDYELILQSKILDKMVFDSAINIILNVSDEKYKLLGNFITIKYNNNKFNEVMKCLNLLPKEEWKRHIKIIAKQTQLILDIRNSNRFESYISANISLRRNPGISNRRLAYLVIKEGIKKFPKASNIDYANYLLIRTLVNWNSIEAIDYAEQFIKKYPSSIYADDVLAELSYVQFFVFNLPIEGEKTINKLLKDYPNSNAVDEGLYHAYTYYYSMCELNQSQEENGENINNENSWCKKSMEIDSLLGPDYE